jgi:uncharacterized protein
MREDLKTLEDVKEGMVLQGVVTNVTAFGAFVDVGVHQDGLVHVSQLAARFVKDPSEVVKVGDRLTVKVLSVDLARKRLALSVRAVQEGGAAQGSQRQARPLGEEGTRALQQPVPQPQALSRGGAASRPEPSFRIRPRIHSTTRRTPPREEGRIRKMGELGRRFYCTSPGHFL